MERRALSNHRQVVYDLLARAKRYHCSITSCWDFEVSALEAARRAGERPLGVTACLAKATALVLARHPRLNRHLFHGWWRPFEVTFPQVRCQLVVVRRGPEGERVLLPLIVEEADRRSVAEIQGLIDHHRTAPLRELPQFAAFERVKRLPRLALRWFSYKARSDPAFYARYFGSYGVSALASKGGSAHALNAVSNTGVSFLLGGVHDAPVVRDGALGVGKVLTVATVVDHFLIDGLEVVEAMRTLRRLLADPALLGLTETGADGAVQPAV